LALRKVQAVNGNNNEQAEAVLVPPEQQEHQYPVTTTKHAQPPAQWNISTGANINGIAVAAAAVIGLTAVYSGEVRQC
jgi:hypothetical protein